ncbi:cytochrome P450 [Massilia forsythiae]|uniref:Cytochrome P450 n=1 Tax=Massilia forsythiae TaxID=2728020 RepID=A0A7Z2ZU59_9BURK|nr:cytochrome P450 [Massilia forsythiae]QJE02218.1 cytochrome P450 [Massilia forsythiae]
MPDTTIAFAGPRLLADLPGPRPAPLFGNLLQMDRARVHRTMEDWSRQYGPLFRVSFPRGDLLAVADSELIAQVLRERPATFRRPAITTEVASEMGMPPGVFEAEGAAWRNQRRMVMQAFAPQAVKAYFPSLVEVARRLRRRWEDAARSGRRIDLGAELRLYTVDIVAGLAFGSDVNTIEHGDNAIQRHLDRILPAVARRSLAPFPYWRYLKLPRDRDLERSVAATRTAVDALVAQAAARMRQEAAPAAQPRNMLEAMLAAAAQEGSGVSERDVAGNVLTMLLAGEDTTSNSLAWLIWLLHRHPQALARARAEVLAVAPDLDTLAIEQVDRLDFVEACAHEALRLKPPAAFIPLEALADTVVGDVQVTRGTIVWCVMRAGSLDDASFADAAAFDPQRWLDDAVSKKASMPFGAGPRTCPGRYLALLEIKVAMAMLLARFDIADVATGHGGEPDEKMGFVMEPETLRMRLRLRG